MLKLNNFEISSVAGGDDKPTIVCDVEAASNQTDIFGRFTFESSVGKDEQEGIYKLMKLKLLDKGVSKALSADYNFACYKYEKDEL